MQARDSPQKFLGDGGRAVRVVGKASAAKASLTIGVSVISQVSFSFLTCHAFRERKTKHININKIGGIVPGLGGWQNFVYVFWDPDDKRNLLMHSLPCK